MGYKYYRSIHSSYLSEWDTDQLGRYLRRLLVVCDKRYFAPVTRDIKDLSGEVPHRMIADIQRITAELTSRYLLAGF